MNNTTEELAQIIRKKQEEITHVCVSSDGLWKVEMNGLLVITQIAFSRNTFSDQELFTLSECLNTCIQETSGEIAKSLNTLVTNFQH